MTTLNHVPRTRIQTRYKPLIYLICHLQTYLKAMNHGKIFRVYQAKFLEPLWDSSRALTSALLMMKIIRRRAVSGLRSQGKQGNSQIFSKLHQKIVSGRVIPNDKDDIVLVHRVGGILLSYSIRSASLRDLPRHVNTVKILARPEAPSSCYDSTSRCRAFMAVIVSGQRVFVPIEMNQTTLAPMVTGGICSTPETPQCMAGFTQPSNATSPDRILHVRAVDSLVFRSRALSSKSWDVTGLQLTDPT